MKLSAFSITNFRSITDTEKLTLNDITVLVGKNNEGKSNVLTALQMAINAIVGAHAYDEKYNWDRDIPVSLKKKKKGELTCTEFLLEFELSPGETVAFYEKFKVRINGLLPIRIHYSKDVTSPDIKVVKQGRGSIGLNKKSKAISSYIAENIEFNYIPAVRHAQDAQVEIARMIMSKLRELEATEDFKRAIKTINELQQPVIDEISRNVKQLLVDFVPDIKSVNIRYSPHYFSRTPSASSLQINIDDGTETDLQYKGDGVKNLVAIGLLKNSNVHENKASIIAFEEPESHLHPEAITMLKQAIYQLAPASQVIITTHNPIFVNRAVIESNIIVGEGKARQATSLRQIRTSLGVSLSDNMYDAKVVVLVEGDTDASILSAVLSARSEIIRNAFADNSLVIMRLHGASNLSTQLNLLNSLLCHSIVFFDDDESGRNAIKQAVAKNLLDRKDYFTCHCEGRAHSELEDMISSSIYDSLLLEKYGIDVHVGPFNNKIVVWSDRIKDLFTANGKIWDSTVETEIKMLVADAVVASPDTAMDASSDVVLNNLKVLIEQSLS